MRNTSAKLKNLIAHRLPASLTKRFVRDESGAITAYSIFAFFLMMAFVGMTIDMMRHESIRTRLQSTSDRAVLAAADLDQKQTAEAVVYDYFKKAGMEEFLDGVEVDKGLNYKTVSTRLRVEMPTWFMNMMGTNSIPVVAGARAEERIQNVEVSLVLDVSGSMGSNSRIQNLRTAADQFVRTLMEGNEEQLDDGTGLTSVSVVPYHAVVNVPDSIMDEIPVDNFQEYSNCVRFRSSDFQTLEMRLLNPDTVSQPQEYDRIAHFDPWNYNRYTYNGVPYLRSPWCQASDYAEILPHSIDVDDLTGKIASLGAGGNTAIDLGMKWAAALLDPSTRAMTTRMIEKNRLDPDVARRPASYDDQDTLKVVVLMTDGANTTQYDLKDGFKRGMSPVWYSEDWNEYTVYHNRSGTSYDWYDPQDHRWRDRVIGGNDARQLSYAELYNRYSIRYVADYFFRYSSNERNRYRGALTGYSGYSTADNYTRQICDRLKGEDVVIFSIGFEAPWQGQQLMQYCASTAGHYFDVQGIEISEAFSSIAKTIQQLRLTL